MSQYSTKIELSCVRGFHHYVQQQVEKKLHEENVENHGNCTGQYPIPSYGIYYPASVNEEHMTVYHDIDDDNSPGNLVNLSISCT